MDDNVVRTRCWRALLTSACLVVLLSNGMAVAQEASADPPADDGPAPALPTELWTLYEQVRPAVVRVAADGSFGSGFVVGDGSLIATAHHVVAGAESVWIKTVDGTEIEARRVAWDRKADAALLQLEQPLEVTPLPLSPDEPEVGDPLFAIGHPLVMGAGPRGSHAGLLEWSFTAGMVSVVGEQQIQTTVMLHPGNSGGPIFDDQGRVVGIAVERKGDFGVARKIDVVAELQAELDDPDRSPRRPVHVSAYMAPRVGLTAFPAASQDRQLFGSFGAEFGMTLDHRLLLGLRAQRSWLASRAERDAGRLGRHTEFSFLAGPSFTLARRHSSPVRFRLQPHAIIGVGLSSRGFRETTLQYTDPACDPSSGPCPYVDDQHTDWNHLIYLLVGAGIRLDINAAFLDVGITLNPVDPASSIGVGLTLGVRFGKP